MRFLESVRQVLHFSRVTLSRTGTGLAELRLPVDRVGQTIDSLLERWPDGFRNKDLAEALGVSRSRASQILSVRRLCGELTIAHERRRGRYIRGPPSTTHLSADALFWRELTDLCPCIGYLPLRACGSPRLRTRSQVRAAIGSRHHEQRFAIVDFACIDFLSEAACDELLRWLVYVRILRVHPINATQDVATTLARAGLPI